MNKDELQVFLKQNRLWLKKSYGQHFLVESEYIDTIIKASGIGKDSIVVEVGPGLGILTAPLSDMVADGKVISLEADYDLVSHLRQGIGNRKNVSIIHTNALQFNWEELETNSQPYQIVANLPYSIANPLLYIWLVTLKKKPSRITVMVQREVADRLVSPAGNRNRSLSTIMVELASTARKICDIPPTAFFPPPKVDSSIIDLVVKPEPVDQKVLKVAKAGFSNKRRTLVNSLTGALHLTKIEVADLLGKCNIDPIRRAETLTIDEWIKLAKLVTDKISQN